MCQSDVYTFGCTRVKQKVKWWWRYDTIADDDDHDDDDKKEV